MKKSIVLTLTISVGFWLLGFYIFQNNIDFGTYSHRAETVAPFFYLVSLSWLVVSAIGYFTNMTFSNLLHYYLYFWYTASVLAFFIINLFSIKGDESVFYPIFYSTPLMIGLLIFDLYCKEGGRAARVLLIYIVSGMVTLATVGLISASHL